MVRGDRDKGCSAVRIEAEFERALTGLDAFKKCMLLYLKEGGRVDIHIARIREVKGGTLLVDYCREIEGCVVLDIKPYFQSLDG